MAASSTDKFRKVAPNTGWQLDASGISDASVTSFGLVSATGLPTDTGVTLTIDRVDSSGNKTPSKMERITGVISGTTVSSCVRGVGGTAQAHSAGAVVEIVIDSSIHNDMVSGVLAEHGQDGKHGAAFHALTEKTTPADADEFGLIDSAASYVLKRLTWAKLKIALWAGFQPPQGFLINGKISVTDTGSGLTVAIKTLAGSDPSSTDPVYVRIGDTVRTISSALSVTKADGTNWFNAGSSELATKEIDYFVYLGYNATDGVVIGFSRIPYANSYDDFSTTTTNEKYCAISTITNAAATDYYEVIGRFAATLSAGAGYTWSVPTFTAKNLIQRPVYETRVLSAATTYSYSIGNGTQYIRYQIKGRRMKCGHSFTAGSTTTFGTTMTWTLPFSVVSSAKNYGFGTGIVLDAGVQYYNVLLSIISTTTFSWMPQNDAGNGCLTNTKPMTWGTSDSVNGMFEVEI